MTHTETTCPNRIALCAGKNGAHPAALGDLASVFEKSATELNLKKNYKNVNAKYKLLYSTLES